MFPECVDFNVNSFHILISNSKPVLQTLQVFCDTVIVKLLLRVVVKVQTTGPDRNRVNTHVHAGNGGRLTQHFTG